MKRILTLMIAAVMSYGPAALAVPQQINYQGHLTRPNGTPLDTTVAMAFTIYASPAGNDTFWTESRAGVTVTNGLFHILLGSVSTLGDLFNGDRWLGIKIGNNSEMTPRQQIVSVAHAYRVGTIAGASGGAVTGDVVIWGNGTISGDGTILGKGNIGLGNANDGSYAFVSGYNNRALGNYSAIGGGANNFARGAYSVVAGGGSNSPADSNSASAIYSCIGGGHANVASGVASVVAGGTANVSSAGSATVAGGLFNTASGSTATVGGGNGNTATGASAVIPGGSGNYASGDYSMAAGRNVNVSGRNSVGLGTFISCAAESAFVWSDGSAPVAGIGMSRTFNVKATRGTRIWTSPDISAGVTIGAGGNAWVGVSDSTKKRNIRGLDTQDILARFSSLPLKRWEYQSEEPGVEHIGPMAQDFWNAFHLGNEPLGISTIDADGVMMATIQELCKRIVELQTRVETLEAGKQATTNRK